jgi:hypothetical protein
LHKVLFGLTAGEALAFGSTRLVQLRDVADDLVRSQHADDASRRFTIDDASRISLDSLDVAKLLYVVRITTLADPRASLERIGKGDPAEFTSPNVSLARFWSNYVADSGPGQDTLDAARELYKSRETLQWSLIDGDQVDWSRFDVAPEFWLQQDAREYRDERRKPSPLASLLAHLRTAEADAAKVATPPPEPTTPLHLKTRADEEKRKHIPANERYASAAPGPRKERPRKR